MRNIRLLLSMLTVLAAGVASAQTSGAPVYACVQIRGNQLVTFQIIGDGGACPQGETRMLVVAQRDVGFTASPVESRDQSTFAATILTSKINLLMPHPVVVATFLYLNTDTGFYTIPRDLTCVPLLDGNAVGSAVPLMAPAASWMDPPRSPNTLWPLIREEAVSTAGPHDVALGCKSASAFRFKGTALVIVLQPVAGA